MKKAIMGLCVAATIAGASGAACAADEGFYVLGAIGQESNGSNKADIDSALTAAGAAGFASSYSEPTYYKLQAGYQINKNFAVEGGYIGSNDLSYSATGGNLAGPISASGSITGWNLIAVGMMPLADQFSLLGKIGIADVRSSVTMAGPGAVLAASSSKTDITYGIGAKLDINSSVFLRGDLDSYKGSGGRGNLWSFGVGYKF